MTVKLWLDDVRPAPDGWLHVATAEEAIAYFARGTVEAASLDHDLGPSDAGTGYDVLAWIERAMNVGAWYGPLPRLFVHSANPVGRKRMDGAIDAIKDAYALLDRGEVAPSDPVR